MKIAWKRRKNTNTAIAARGQIAHQVSFLWAVVLASLLNKKEEDAVLNLQTMTVRASLLSVHLTLKLLWLKPLMWLISPPWLLSSCSWSCCALWSSSCVFKPLLVQLLWKQTRIACKLIWHTDHSLPTADIWAFWKQQAMHSTKTGDLSFPIDS